MGIGPFEDPRGHGTDFARDRLDLGIGMRRSKPEPEPAVVTAFNGHADRRVALGIGRPYRHAVGPLQVLHVDAEDLGRDAVGLADPGRLAVLVDGHERTVVDGGVGGEGPGGELAGLGRPFEDAGMRAGFGQRDGDGVAAGTDELHDNLVGLIGEVAVGVLDADINQVPRFHLVLGPDESLPAVLGTVPAAHFAFEPLAKGLLILVGDLPRCDLQFGVGGDANLGIR